MILLDSHQPVFIDVDETLVIHNKDKRKHKDNIKIGDCYFIPHKPHIEQLKAHAARKHTIVVWSKGGATWANTVVKKLKLEKYVDLILEKPMWAIDDQVPTNYIDTYYINYDPFKK